MFRKKILNIIYKVLGKGDNPGRQKRFKLFFDESNKFVNNSTLQHQGRITITGENNSVFIGNNVKLNVIITIQGDDNVVEITDNSVVRGQILVKGKNQRVSIGSNTTFQSVYILCQEGCNIEIGDWCMFSRDIEIRTTDAHSVVDVETRERINQPASVTIGNHVWVGVGSLISKGACIPNDSIVGAYSFVNKKFTEENVLLAGTPAEIVRQGVTWNRGRKPKFSKAQLEHWKEPPSKTE
ncbi:MULTISPECIES: acyltransferase [unclassified Halomonas]|uniref:acyltransferase n=1 Tax=unclassified Halomonas TaxID=2609666 RepID=UPI004034602C